MASREERDRSLRSSQSRNLDSPFVEEELFLRETDSEWEVHLAALEAESPFRHAFEQSRSILVEPEELEEEFTEEDKWTKMDYFPADEAEAQAEEGLVDWEDGIVDLDEERSFYAEREDKLFFEDEEFLEEEASPVDVSGSTTDFVPLPVEHPGGGRIQNKRDPLPKDIETIKGYLGKRIQLHRLAAIAWRALVTAARRDSIREPLLVVVSGYRSYSLQAKLFQDAVDRYKSKSEARKWVAPPGSSAHQSGRAIDFYLGGKNSSGNVASLRQKPAYLWLTKNARRFGFYPYDREPWHWEYNPPGSKGRLEGEASVNMSTFSDEVVPAQLSQQGTAKPAAELVRFAQRVLNATEGERLSDDGGLGQLTRAALERFRKKYGLGIGGVLDVSTELALVQKALEKLAQASMFAQLGVRDTKTEQAITAFKASRQLETNSRLDAPTRRALMDALARVAHRPNTGATMPQKPASTTPSTYLDGKLWTFQAKTLSTLVAVFCPPAALSKREVEVLVFAHGLLNGCRRPKSIPDGIITDAPFKLGDIVAASNRPVVLVVPYLDWANPGGEQAFDKSKRKWHALGKPANLNSVVAEVLTELGRMQGSATPSLRNLMIAGHSRAYDFLEPLVHSRSDPQMQQGALAKLSQVWAFDSTYTGDVRNWESWLNANPHLQVSVFYVPSSKTGRIGNQFYSKRGGRLSVTRIKEGHCEVPARRLPGLLKSPAYTTDKETETYWSEDELESYYANLEDEGHAPELYNSETAPPCTSRLEPDREFLIRDEGEMEVGESLDELEEEEAEEEDGEAELPEYFADEERLEASEFLDELDEEEVEEEAYTEFFDQDEESTVGALQELLQALYDEEFGYEVDEEFGYEVDEEAFEDFIDRRHYAASQGMEQFIGGLILDSPSPVADVTVAVPPFTFFKRFAMFVPILSPAENADALRWNQRNHPTVSGIDPTHIRTDLARYVNFTRIEVSIRVYNDAHPAAPIQMGTPPIDAVFVEAVHQFQAKCFFKKSHIDGKAGESTLDSLGIVNRKGLNTVDKPNSTALKRLKDVGVPAAVSWFNSMVNPSFLGWTFSDGIHLTLARKLRIAEKELLTSSEYRKYHGMTPVELGKVLGLSEEHKGSRPTHSTGSMHTFGLAADINYEGNPYVAGMSGQGAQQANANFTNAVNNAALLISGVKVNFTSQYLHNLRTRSTSDIYKELSERNNDLRAYFVLDGNQAGIRARLQQHLAAKPPTQGVFASGETLDEATRRWERKIAQNLQELSLNPITTTDSGGKKVEVHRSNFTRTNGTNRDPRKGFLSLNRDLVVVLRDKACLAWGAVDFGQTASGDIMHFDARVCEIGALLVRSIKEGHPCLSCPPLTPAGAGVAASAADAGAVEARDSKLLASLASRILSSPRITLATSHVSRVRDKATARQNIEDTANGLKATRSNYEGAPGGTVQLNRRLLEGLLNLANTYSYSISELAGGSHSRNSRHYAGVAADVNVINGQRVSASHPDFKAFMQACRKLGATEVLGPGSEGHATHVHCAWPDHNN